MLLLLSLLFIMIIMFINVRVQSILKARGRVLLAIKGMWYDVTDFMPEHPGGEAILRAASMQPDATPNFLAVHDANLLDEATTRALQIGRVMENDSNKDDDQMGNGTAFLAQAKVTPGAETKWWDRCTPLQASSRLILAVTPLKSRSSHVN